AVIIRLKIASFRPDGAKDPVPIGFELIYNEVRLYFFRKIVYILQRLRMEDKKLLADLPDEQLIQEVDTWRTNAWLRSAKQAKKLHEEIVKQISIVNDPGTPEREKYIAKLMLAEYILTLEYDSGRTRAEILLHPTPDD